MEILTPGEKIKNIRKKYKIKQKILAEGVTSPSMLGYYENGKYKLNEEVANKICRKLNKLIPDSNFLISPDELLSSKEAQIRDYGNQIISNLEKVDESTLRELKKIFSEYAFNSEKIRIYYVLASYYLNIRKSTKISLRLFEEILYIALHEPDNVYICPIILLMQRIYNHHGKFGETQDLYFRTFEVIRNKKREITGYIIYNFALAFHKEKQLEIAIKLYNEALDYLESPKIIEYCKNNLGVCYFLNKKYRQSNDIFLDLLNSVSELFKRASYYSNMLTNYIGLKEELSLKLYISKLEKLLISSKDKDEMVYQSYYCLGIAYLFLKDKYSAMKSFEKELELGIDSNNHHFFIEKYEYCIEKLVGIYNENDKSKFKSLEKYIINIPNDLYNPKFFLQILQKYINVYTKDELALFVSKIEKKIK